jgi:transcription elongation factor Elf1
MPELDWIPYPDSNHKVVQCPECFKEQELLLDEVKELNKIGCHTCCYCGNESTFNIQIEG